MPSGVFPSRVLRFFIGRFYSHSFLKLLALSLHILKRNKKNIALIRCFHPKKKKTPHYSLALCSFRFTRCNIPPADREPVLFIWISENKKKLVFYAFPSRSYMWMWRKWYLGLDFQSRLLLLAGKKKRSAKHTAVLLGGNLFSFHTGPERLLMH